MATNCPLCDAPMYLDGPDGLDTDFYVCDDCNYVTLADPEDDEQAIDSDFEVD